MFFINLYAIFIDNTLADFPFKLFYTTYCTIGVACAVFAKIRESLDVRIYYDVLGFNPRPAAWFIDAAMTIESLC